MPETATEPSSVEHDPPFSDLHSAARLPITALGWNRPAFLWIGRGLSSVFALFMLAASAAPKLLQLPMATGSMSALGWPSGHTFALGMLELGCVVLYLVPRTSLLGAVCSTGLLGGALATQLRVGNPLFSHVLFSLYVGVVMWGGLWLRDARVRALLPFMPGSGEPERRGAAGACSGQSRRGGFSG